MNYYSIDIPHNNELVLVVFNENLQNEGIFKGKLIEYPNYECIMNYQDATKKRKILSWNKILTLNKNMVAKVDDIDYKTKIIQVSIAYLYENFDKNMLMDNIQSELLIYFNSNKLMTQFIHTLCLVNNYDYEYIWKTFVYHLDTLRRNDNYDKSIWNYFNENINQLDKWISYLNMDPTYIDTIMILFNKKNEIIIQKIITRFGIVNTNNINNIYNIFNTVLTNIKYKYTLKYETTPYYIFQSETIDSNEYDHQEFINNIKSCTDNNTFIKIDFIGKIY
jgi:translation initiation factor 2 alpha subunit (eIF-2alpha)